MACDIPFDVIYLDLWSPGVIPDKFSADTKVLTMIDCMTGYGAAGFVLGEINAMKVSETALADFFMKFGLPRLIIVDADSLFAGVFKSLFANLLIPVVAVSPENHKAIRNENFHRYLNKVERINTADTASMVRWKQGVLFSLYAWNAEPIDGTDIPRSVIAIGREIPFPIDLLPPLPRDGAAE